MPSAASPISPTPLPSEPARSLIDSPTSSSLPLTPSSPFGPYQREPGGARLVGSGVEAVGERREQLGQLAQLLQQAAVLAHQLDDVLDLVTVERAEELAEVHGRTTYGHPRVRFEVPAQCATWQKTVLT